MKEAVVSRGENHLYLRSTEQTAIDHRAITQGAPRPCGNTKTMSEFATKPMGRPVSFDRDGTIEAATNLYWQSGVANTSFNEVSRALNVSKPTLYRYFGDEDGLLSAALEHYVSPLTRNCRFARARAISSSFIFQFFKDLPREIAIFGFHFSGRTPPPWAFFADLPRVSSIFLYLLHRPIRGTF